MSTSRASLSLVPKSADDDVLGAGRLEVDDDLADRGDERGGAGQEPGQQLGDAERGRGRDDPGDGGRPVAAGRGVADARGGCGTRSAVVLTAASSARSM